MEYIIQHTIIGFCWWDIPALLVLIGVIAYFIVRWSKMKKEQEDLEDELSSLYANDTQDGAGAAVQS